MKISNFQFPISNSPRAARAGFTLVEMLVAITLFSLAVAVAVGGFVRALRTQRQIVALVSANSNASLAIEQMAREIRTGTGFQPCVTACTELKFTNANKENVTYFLNGNKNSLDRTAGNNAPQTLTAANVKIYYLDFWIPNDPNFPARVTISIGIGGVGPGLGGNVTDIQTTVSSRAF